MIAEKNIEIQIPYVPGYNSGETENIAEAIASAIFHAVDKVSKEAFLFTPFSIILT